MSQILCFGDSVAWGAWDSEGGWVQRLRREVDKSNISGKYYWAIHNLGVSGNTSEDLLKRFSNESKSRIEEGDTIVILAIGSNDACWMRKEKRNLVPEKEFVENMIRLISEARGFAKEIIVLGVTAEDESKTIPLPWAPALECHNKHSLAYERILEKICKKEKLRFIPLNKEVGLKMLSDDGVHPNNAGHELIFKKVYAALDLK